MFIPVKRILIIMSLTVVCCKKSNNSAPNDTVLNKVTTDNLELINMYSDDQSERRKAIDGELEWKIVGENDRRRESRVLEMVDSNLLKTSNDYKKAAMIFHHGVDTTSSFMTIKMMKRAVELDPNINKWLLAAGIDRHLIKKGEPQIYGTQYVQDSPDAPIYLDKIDTTKVTDQERIEYGVETLAEQKLKEKRLNRINLYDIYREGKSINDIIKICKTEDFNNSKYNLSEEDINRFGYQLITLEKLNEALLIFELNTELFPNEFNTFDSLGECLFIMGDLNKSKIAYEKSLELNPYNFNAKDYIYDIKEKIMKTHNVQTDI